MKLLTVAVPCYNSAAYMEHCLDTLLTGGEEMEILIVNDGSTKDNTAEIADRYQAAYPTIVRKTAVTVPASMPACSMQRACISRLSIPMTG